MKGFKATLTWMSVLQALVAAQSVKVPLTRRIQHEPVTTTQKLLHGLHSGGKISLLNEEEAGKFGAGRVT